MSEKFVKVRGRHGTKSLDLTIPAELSKEFDINADYTGFVIDDLFVIGYGLDYDQKYRNLPYIGVLKKTKKISK